MVARSSIGLMSVVPPVTRWRCGTTSSLTWLAVSAEQQRRLRDIFPLSKEPGTRDELGIGPVRGSFSDQLSPWHLGYPLPRRGRYFVSSTFPTRKVA